MCKCNHPLTILESIKNKMASADRITNLVLNTTMESLPSPVLNMSRSRA